MKTSSSCLSLRIHIRLGNLILLQECLLKCVTKMEDKIIFRVKRQDNATKIFIFPWSILMEIKLYSRHKNKASLY